jgi:hypothetical protein
MNKLGLLASAAIAGLALPQTSLAQDRPYDGIDGGRPIQIEREPNTLGPAPSTAAPERRKQARKAARARIKVRPRVRVAQRRAE